MAANRWGVIPDVKNGRDWDIRDHVSLTPMAQVARTGTPNRVQYMKDQRQHGSCTGFMRTRLQRMALQHAGLPDIDLSELHAYYHNRVFSGLSPTSDTGASIRGSIDAGRKKGACREVLWNYANADGYLNVKPEQYADDDAADHQIVDAFTIPNNIDMIIQAINDGFGVGLGASVFYDAFEMAFVNTGRVAMPQQGDKVVGAHAFVLDGWDLDVNSGEFDWANSWGKVGPLGGFGKMPFSYITNYAFDIWAVRVVESPDPKPTPRRIKWIGASINGKDELLRELADNERLDGLGVRYDDLTPVSVWPL